MAASVYEKSVFINCPFDPAFEPLFYAIVLTVVARGFVPCCAYETGGRTETRIARIARGILEARFSIHDLSRYRGEGDRNLARFNMPLELGMALGIQYLSDADPRASARQHTWLALVPTASGQLEFISDLRGYDLQEHDGQPVTVIRSVAAWLSLQPGSSLTPTPKAILAAFPEFRQLLEQARAQELGVLIWPAITRIAADVVLAMPV